MPLLLLIPRLLCLLLLRRNDELSGDDKLTLYSSALDNATAAPFFALFCVLLPMARLTRAHTRT